MFYYYVFVSNFQFDALKRGIDNPEGELVKALEQLQAFALSMGRIHGWTTRIHNEVTYVCCLPKNKVLTFRYAVQPPSEAPHSPTVLVFFVLLTCMLYFYLTD